LEENMTFQYVSVDEAIKRSGVRMVVVGGVPSPAFVGLHHIELAPTFGFHIDLGSAT